MSPSMNLSDKTAIARRQCRRLNHIILMRTFSDLQNRLTEEQIKNLGLAGSIKSANDLGFVDFAANKNPTFKNFYLDLENIGVLRSINPRTVVRDVQPEENNFNTNKTWRAAIESEYYYSTYNIVENPIGNISFTDLSTQKYLHEDNDFFIPFILKKSGKLLKSNKFKFSRFRFKRNTSNTNELRIQTPNGTILNRPAEANLAANTKKHYYVWDHRLTGISSGYLQAQGISPQFASQISGASGILSGYYIPYPTTLDKQDYIGYNVPTQIAPRYNQENKQSIKGLLAVSIGSANQKQIVYVSPHGMQTGFANTYENFNLTESKLINLTPGSKRKYLTVTGAGFNLANGIYREVKNYPSSGYLPRYRNVVRNPNAPQFTTQATSATQWSGNSNPSVPRKEVYWDGYNWNISVNNQSIYQSLPEIDLRAGKRVTRSFIDNSAFSDMVGKYSEIPNSSNNISRVWQKFISSGKVSSFTKSIIFWDPTQNLDPLNAALSENSGIYISVTPNYYNESLFTGNNIASLNAQYSGNRNLFNAGTGYKYFYKTGNRGERRGRITPKFFDGWHLPFQPTGEATFLNSWVLPFVSGQTVLATGNFISQGNQVITGAGFWSGIGFTYVTGEFYDSAGNLFSGQAISGNGVEYYNITGYENYTLQESGIITGRPNYINPSLWTTGYRNVPLFSGASGISTTSGIGSQLILSGQTYWYPKSYLYATNVRGISFSQSGVQINNGIVYLNNVPYSGYQTGTISAPYVRQFITTVCDSGKYEKYSNYVYTDGSGNNLLYDILGDYGFKDQWIMINETNRYVSGTSGYSVLFVNKTKSVANYPIIPRVCWWDGVGGFANSGLQVNNTNTPVVGGYTVTRLPIGADTFVLSNSGLSINNRKFLNLLSSDRGVSIGEFGNLYANIINSNSKLLYIPQQNGLTPFNSAVPNSGSFSTKLSITGYVSPQNISSWWQKFQGQLSRLEVITSTTAPDIFSAKFNSLSPVNNPSPNLLNGSFYFKSKNISKNKLIQLKTVFLDSRYVNSGQVLPTGYSSIPYLENVWNYPLYIKYSEPESAGGENGINTQVGSVAADPSQPTESGIIIGDQYVTMSDATGVYKVAPSQMMLLYSGGVVEPIKQNIPLKDTLFYKFYNHIYNGDKTLATGTWDGTIPSGTYFTVELISTYFNDDFGIDGGNLGIFYAGNNGDIKSDISSAYSLPAITGAYPKVDARNYNLSYVSHAVNKNKHVSRMHAKTLARKRMQEVYNKTAKLNAPYLLFQNSKYNRLQGFLTNKYIQMAQTGQSNPFNIF